MELLETVLWPGFASTAAPAALGRSSYADTFLPAWSLRLTGLTVPLVEVVAGALRIVGLRVREALLALGFILVLVTFGHLLKEPLYRNPSTRGVIRATHGLSRLWHA